MGNITGIAKSHYLWAVLCAVGYFGLMLPGAVQALQFGGIIALWVVLGIIGVAGMYYGKLVPKVPLNTKIAHAWTAVVIVGLVANAMQLFNVFNFMAYGFNYAAVWFLVTAIGFAYTGYVWPKAKEAYYAGALLNVVGVVGVLAKVPEVGGNVFLILGLATVLPLLYAGSKN